MNMLVICVPISIALFRISSSASVQNPENQIHSILKRLEDVEKKVEILENENQILKSDNRQIWSLLLVSKFKHREEVQTFENQTNNSQPRIKPIDLQNTDTTVSTNDDSRNNGEDVRNDSCQRRLLTGSLSTTIAPVTRVAFKAATSKYINHIGGHQIIEYDKVLLNEGNAYSALHGHMIAPVKGVYLLSFSIFAVHPTKLALEIVHNGVRIDVMYANSVGISNDDSQSRVFPVLLEQGDMIWLRTYPGYEGTNVYGSDGYFYNSFSGVLLYETAN